MRDRPHARTSRKRVRRSPCARSGLTLLEVVLATVLLTFVVSVTMSAFNYIYGQSERQVARLGAMELANRLMIIFLDDENEFKRQPHTLDFDGRQYHWTSREEGVTVLPVIDGESARAIKSAERLRNIEIEVWLAGGAGASDVPDPAAPSARVVRLVDVIYMNPDSVSNTMSSDEGIKGIIDRVMRTHGGSAVPRTGTPGGTTSGGSSRRPGPAPSTSPGGSK